MQLELLSQSDLETLSGLIKDARNIIVCCHKSPDGDAIGSSLAWVRLSETSGQRPTCYRS